MKMWNKIIKTAIPVAASLLFATVANATVVYPALDIQQLNGDTGVTSTATGLTMGGTAITVINSDGSVRYSFAQQPFSLTSDITGSGSLNVGNGSLLTATFSNLKLSDLGGLPGGFFSGVGNFSADLTYTGGSMVTALATANMTGRIEGAFNNATGAITWGNPFHADNLIAKIGGKVQVVPVPAAVWLFGSALLGLAGIAKRKKAA